MKFNRIMETLLVGTRPKVQYFGKILGIGLLVLTHIVFYVILGVAQVIALKANDMVERQGHGRWRRYEFLAHARLTFIADVSHLLDSDYREFG